MPWVSRELLARAWQAGAGPGDGPLTIDLDSTICETYGLAKEGGAPSRLHRPAGLSPAGRRRWHWRRADGTAQGGPRQRGAGHFLRETVGRVRCAGARGQLTVRADSGFYTHARVSTCRKLDVRFSITICQHKSLRHLIEAIPGEDSTPIPYWMAAADVAETTYRGPLRSPGKLRYTMLRLVIVRIRYHLLWLQSIYRSLYYV